MGTLLPGQFYTLCHWQCQWHKSLTPVDLPQISKRARCHDTVLPDTTCREGRRERARLQEEDVERQVLLLTWSRVTWSRVVQTTCTPALGYKPEGQEAWFACMLCAD